MPRKNFAFNNLTLWDRQIRQLEMFQKSISSTISDYWKPAFEVPDDVRKILESPMTDWIRQNEAWINQMNSQMQPILAANEQIKSIAETLNSSTILGVTQNFSLTKAIRIISQADCSRILDIAEQISPVIDNLDIAGLTLNLERIQAQLSYWDSSLEETDYDDISANDDGSLCYQGQCVTQTEINDIWNTFIQNCENLGSKAIESIKDRAWIVQWIYEFICIITTLGLYREIEEHLHKGVLEVRSHANGWDKMFAVKNDNGARVYSAPNTKSVVLGKLDYECIITLLEKQTYWVRFEYQVAEGQTTEAWTATCNLIRYDKLQDNSMALLEEDK